jgi:hypothetical protein
MSQRRIKRLNNRLEENWKEETTKIGKKEKITYLYMSIS